MLLRAHYPRTEIQLLDGLGELRYARRSATVPPADRDTQVRCMLECRNGTGYIQSEALAYTIRLRDNHVH